MGLSATPDGHAAIEPLLPNGKAMSYQDYKNDVSEDVRACVNRMGCQPILFIGSGLSKRYFDGPNWKELLVKMVENCPTCKKSYEYYAQSVDGKFEKIGTKLATQYKNWAWGACRAEFSSSLFSEDCPSEIYLKHAVCKHVTTITPADLTHITDATKQNEIEKLRAIKPHAIITTNYDQLLEQTFPDYHPIIGNEIYHNDFHAVGEILKIHGCVTKPESLVLTQNDYDEFIRKKKYLSAKLLTYFVEHPLLIIGYSITDRNIRGILSDIDELLSPKGELIQNIYVYDYQENASSATSHAKERLIQLEDRRSIRVKCITSDSVDWVFDSFSSTSVIPKVSPKILRALMSRIYDLVRRDSPREVINIDYDTLSRVANSNSEFNKLLGISTTAAGSSLTVDHRYITCQLAEQLGITSNQLHILLNKVKSEKGFDLKASDNAYHVKIMTGRGPKSFTRKYSDRALDLLRQVLSGVPYELPT